MAKEDIHNTRELLNRKADVYISQLFTEDQEDTRRFINDLLAQGFSAARVLKTLSTLSSIRKRLKKPFKNVTADELKTFSAELEQSNYAEWTKHDLKVILRKFL